MECLSKRGTLFVRKEGMRNMAIYTPKIVKNLRLEEYGWEKELCKATCFYKEEPYEVTIRTRNFKDGEVEDYEKQAVREIEKGRARKLENEQVTEEEDIVFWR